MAKLSIPTKLDIDNIIQTIEALRKSPKLMIAIKKKLRQNQLEMPMAEGKRSFKETLIHLIHCSISSQNKIYHALLEKKPELYNLHPNQDWGNLLKLEKLKINELLNYYRLERKILMETLHSLDMGKWGSQFQITGNKKPIDVYKECRSVAMHENQHIETLKKQLKQL